MFCDDNILPISNIIQFIGFLLILKDIQSNCRTWSQRASLVNHTLCICLCCINLFSILSFWSNQLNLFQLRVCIEFFGLKNSTYIFILIQLYTLFFYLDRIFSSWKWCIVLQLIFQLEFLHCYWYIFIILSLLWQW